MTDNRQGRYYRCDSLLPPWPRGHHVAMAKKTKKGLRPNYIRAWRKHRHLTQAQLAERIKVAQGSLSDLENSRFAYTQPVLEALADALNCEPADLIMRPPGAYDQLKDVIAGLSQASQKRAIAVVKALRDDEAA